MQKRLTGRDVQSWHYRFLCTLNYVTVFWFVHYYCYCPSIVRCGGSGVMQIEGSHKVVGTGCLSTAPLHSDSPLSTPGCQGYESVIPKSDAFGSARGGLGRFPTAVNALSKQSLRHCVRPSGVLLKAFWYMQSSIITICVSSTVMSSNCLLTSLSGLNSIIVEETCCVRHVRTLTSFL